MHSTTIYIIGIILLRAGTNLHCILVAILFPPGLEFLESNFLIAIPVHLRHHGINVHHPFFTQRKSHPFAELTAATTRELRNVRKYEEQSVS
jgi:hypothetical protein